jgi:uncharacterized membrane protein
MAARSGKQNIAEGSMAAFRIFEGAALMTENTAVSNGPRPGLFTVAHVVYALHALSLLIGLTTAATIVGAFVFGVPSIVAVVINYVKRGEARGTFLESHFRWQIRTFWFALLWCMIGGVLFLTFVGIPLAVGVFFVAGVWVIYRIARGWLALRDRRPI